jgi:Xaa-Pro dipeptidase
MKRGFPKSEYQQRFEWIRNEMMRKELEVIVLTSPNEIYYYTGLTTQFFQSPSRPYYLLLTPNYRTPIAIFPEIMGSPILETTWVESCRTWVSPNKIDDGVSLLLETVQENLSGSDSCKIGFVLGSETKLHPCYNDIHKIFQGLKSHEIQDVTSLIHEQRSIKSHLEIEKISHICDVVSNSLHNLPNLIELELLKNPSLRSCFTERDVCRVLRSDIMGQQHGADSIPYMMYGLLILFFLFCIFIYVLRFKPALFFFSINQGTKWSRWILQHRSRSYMS